MNKTVLRIPYMRKPEFLAASLAVRGAWLALQAHCSEQENGGRIGPIPARQWDVLLGTSRGKQMIDQLVNAQLAHRYGDGTLVVNGYDTDGQEKYIATRERGRAGGVAKAQRDRALRGDSEPPGVPGPPATSSHTSSHAGRHGYYGKVREGEGRLIDVREREEQQREEQQREEWERKESERKESEGGLYDSIDPRGPAVLAQSVAIPELDYDHEPEHNTVCDVLETSR